MRILISGGVGYIGSTLTETLLQAGHAVTVLDNLSRPGASLHGLCHHAGFEFVWADCRDEHALARAVKGADAIIPLAGIIGQRACDRDPKNAWEINCGAIKTLLRFRSRGQLLIYPCTNSGYGTNTGQVECTEESPLEPVSLYGQSKVTAERAVLDAENTVSLRLATVFGVSLNMRWDLLVNDFVRHAVLDCCIVVFEGHMHRNFVHVRDVADCFKLFLWWHDHASKEPTGTKHWEAIKGRRVFNLGNDSANCTKLELAKKVAGVVGNVYVHEAGYANDPDKRDYLVSNARLRQAGFEAKRSLDDGIKEVSKAVTLL